MLCDKKHSHVQWRDFKMNVLVCDDDQQIVDSIIEELKKKSEEMQSFRYSARNTAERILRKSSRKILQMTI